MTEWWHTLDTAGQVFWAIALFGSLALAFQIILMLVGLGGHDLIVGDADLSGAGDHSSGLAFLSVRTVIAFFAGFGWAGVIADDAGLSVPLASGIALVAGLAMMATVFWILRRMMSLTCTGTLDYRNAVGQTASIYITVPAAMAGPGQVEVLVQSRLCTVQAMTRATAALPPRAKVRVVELIDRNTLLVEPLA
jgi:hypothetical protein